MLLPLQAAPVLRGSWLVTPLTDEGGARPAMEVANERAGWKFKCTDFLLEYRVKKRDELTGEPKWVTTDYLCTDETVAEADGTPCQ